MIVCELLCHGEGGEKIISRHRKHFFVSYLSSDERSRHHVC